MSILRSLRALIGNGPVRRKPRPGRQTERSAAAPIVGVHTYSQRLSPPFCGQVQIAESAYARALTLDGARWEFQSVHTALVADGAGGERVERRFRHIDSLAHDELLRVAAEGSQDGRPVGAHILELAHHISTATLPFPPNDGYEYWLLDAKDGSPLAFIFSCADPADIKHLPVRPEWTALPATVMPITKTEDEVAADAPPVNYRFERLVAERAGQNPKAQWFRRDPAVADDFPALLVREDWQEEGDHALCQRYLQRQASRLLMLHGLAHEVRLRLEAAVRPNVAELARFCSLYPAQADPDLITAMRVEARLRGANGD